MYVTQPGELRSLDYGQVSEYAKNLNCSWLLVAPQDKVSTYIKQCPNISVF